MFKEVNDPWAMLRNSLELCKSVDPKVELLGITMMDDHDIVDQIIAPAEKNAISYFSERVPGYVARMSHFSESTPNGDIKLCRKLLRMKPIPHLGPFEHCQWIWRITGITKSCLTQFDRHRIGVGFVQMSGRFIDRNKTGFVYNIYDYIENKKQVKKMLEFDSMHNDHCMQEYNIRRDQGATKQDARKVLPVGFASGTFVHMNSVSLRNFFILRLDGHAEWEIRRMAKIMWDKCMKIAPSHFDDMIET